MHVDDYLLVQVKVLGDELENRLANYLVSRISEDPCCGGIPACDDAIEGLAHNYVVRGFDNRRELGKVSGTDTHRLFRPSIFRDVADRP